MSTRSDTDYISLIDAMPPGAVVTLQGISWGEYEHLLEQLGDGYHVRLTYDQGRLQIMSPSRMHEIIIRLIPHLMLALAEECDGNLISLGSTTLRKRKNKQGLEPDDSFYFKRLKEILGKETFDLSVDPPPELAIEVDLTSSSMSKFHIFATIGVPELWRQHGKKMHFYRLVDGQYIEITHSNLFPFLTPDVVVRFIRKGQSEGIIPMVKAFRTWIRRHK